MEHGIRAAMQRELASGDRIIERAFCGSDRSAGDR
jgi:hypothetical protein